jgi:hypothetical protein
LENRSRHSEFGPTVIQSEQVGLDDPTRWSSPPNPPYWAQEQIIWDQMQEELSRLSPNSTRIVAKGSNHDIHVERPELVIQAVRNVYDAAVDGSPIKHFDVGGQLQ